jgi:hypothetical protein
LSLKDSSSFVSEINNKSTMFSVSTSGILTFIRSDFPSSRKQSLESEKIETLCHEVYISDRKWLIAGAYKPPSMLKQ